MKNCFWISFTFFIVRFVQYAGAQNEEWKGKITKSTKTSVPFKRNYTYAY